MRSRFAAVTTAAALAVSACSAADDTIKVVGVVSIHAPDYTATDGCTGKGSLADVHLGAPVIVSDADGRQLDATSLTTAEAGSLACVLLFNAEVPAGHGVYEFTVAGQRSRRYPEHQLGGEDLVIRMRQSFLPDPGR